MPLKNALASEALRTCALQVLRPSPSPWELEQITTLVCSPPRENENSEGVPRSSKRARSAQLRNVMLGVRAFYQKPRRIALLECEVVESQDNIIMMPVI